jgi:hypothetical protein
MLAIEASTFAERVRGALVEHRRAAVHGQPAVGVRQREHRVLHRRIGGLALGEHRPRDERALEVLGRGIGPAGAQERLVGERALESHPVE